MPGANDAHVVFMQAGTRAANTIIRVAVRTTETFSCRRSN
jgi:hypothetical protein